MPIITHDRPDPRFYVNIQQGDDGNWSSDQMSLTDVTSVRPGGITSTSKGLRSITQDAVDSYCAQAILTNAPADMQRNGLYYVQQHAGATGDPVYQAYQAMFTWINNMQTYRDTLKTAISTMTFDQITIYSVPNQNWPAKPSNMPIPAAGPEAMTSRAVITPRKK